MIDVVSRLDTVVDLDDIFNHPHQVQIGHRALGKRNLARQVQAPVQLVSTDLAQIIATRLEEQVLHELLGVVQCGRVAGAKLLVELQEGLLLRTLIERLLVNRGSDVGVIGHRVDVLEQLEDLVVRRVSDGAQKHRRRQLTLAIDLHRQDVTACSLKLQPCTTTGDQLGHAHLAAGGAILGNGEVHAGRANQLTDNNTLGTVDNECTRFGHQREVTHVDIRFADLARVVVA